MADVIKTTSWVIRNKETYEVVCETYNDRLVAAVNRDKYEVIPILKYLQSLNKKDDNDH